MARIAIIDDEVLIAEQLERQIIKFGHSSAGIATSYEEALELLDNNQPELLLLDIRLYGDKTGVDVAELVNEKYRVPFIYLTSHMDPSSLERAKLTCPAGYLTKPYQERSLYTTIEISLFNSLKSLAPKPTVISFAEGKRTIEVSADDIYFLEADHVYIKVTTKDRVLLVRKSLNEIIEEMPAQGFLRIHRSFIVNLNHVEEFGAAYLKVNGQKIPVGRTYKDAVRRALSL